MLLNTIGDKLELGTITAVIGLLVVFAMLVFLILCVGAMARGVQLIATKKSSKVASSQTTEANTASENIIEDNQEAIVAAITGALAAIFASEQHITPNKAKAKFIVKSIKRI